MPRCPSRSAGRSSAPTCPRSWPGTRRPPTTRAVARAWREHDVAGLVWWQAGGGPEVAPVHPELALCLSTSGSTGSPKFVRLSATNVLSNAQAIRQALRIGADEVALAHLPLHYSYGLSVLHSHLAAGSTVVLTAESVVRPTFWEQLHEHRVTTLPHVPYGYQMLDRVGFAERDLPAAAHPHPGRRPARRRARRPAAPPHDRPRRRLLGDVRADRGHGAPVRAAERRVRRAGRIGGAGDPGRVLRDRRRRARRTRPSRFDRLPRPQRHARVRRRPRGPGPGRRPRGRAGHGRRGPARRRRAHRARPPQPHRQGVRAAVRPRRGRATPPPPPAGARWPPSRATMPWCCSSKVALPTPAPRWPARWRGRCACRLRACAWSGSTSCRAPRRARSPTPSSRGHRDRAAHRPRRAAHRQRLRRAPGRARGHPAAGAQRVDRAPRRGVPAVRPHPRRLRCRPRGGPRSPMSRGCP